MKMILVLAGTVYGRCVVTIPLHATYPWVRKSAVYLVPACCTLHVDVFVQLTRLLITIMAS
jgi:hypothetical protein